MKTINCIQSIIFSIGKKIPINDQNLLMATSPTNTGMPHLEINDFMYHYVVTEKGYEFERKSTKNLKMLLYWIFEPICSNLSYKYELQHRVEGQDIRIIAFQKKIELLCELNEKWGEMAKVEFEKIKLNAPLINN